MVDRLLPFGALLDISRNTRMPEGDEMLRLYELMEETCRKGPYDALTSNQINPRDYQEVGLDADFGLTRVPAVFVYFDGWSPNNSLMVNPRLEKTLDHVDGRGNFNGEKGFYTVEGCGSIYTREEGKLSYVCWRPSEITIGMDERICRGGNGNIVYEMERNLVGKKLTAAVVCHELVHVVGLTAIRDRTCLLDFRRDGVMDSLRIIFGKRWVHFETRLEEGMLVRSQDGSITKLCCDSVDDLKNCREVEVDLA